MEMYTQGLLREQKESATSTPSCGRGKEMGAEKPPRVGDDLTVS